MVRGRSRYLDGSEAKVKEVTLEHLTLYGFIVSKPSTLNTEGLKVMSMHGSASAKRHDHEGLRSSSCSLLMCPA
jgi:hypothetical protein